MLTPQYILENLWLSCTHTLFPFFSDLLRSQWNACVHAKWLEVFNRFCCREDLSARKIFSTLKEFSTSNRFIILKRQRKHCESMLLSNYSDTPCMPSNKYIPLNRLRTTEIHFKLLHIKCSYRSEKILNIFKEKLWCHEACTA